LPVIPCMAFVNRELPVRMTLAHAFGDEIPGCYRAPATFSLRQQDFSPPHTRTLPLPSPSFLSSSHTQWLPLSA
jgi:hypothetical protein